MNLNRYLEYMNCSECNVGQRNPDDLLEIKLPIEYTQLYKKESFSKDVDDFKMIIDSKYWTLLILNANDEIVKCYKLVFDDFIDDEPELAYHLDLIRDTHNWVHQIEFKSKVDYDLKVLVKPKEQLVKQLEDFIAKHKDNFTDSGMFSEDSFRTSQMDFITEIAGREMYVKKIMHTDNISYHYEYLWFHDGDKQYCGSINPEDIVKEIDNE